MDKDIKKQNMIPGSCDEFTRAEDIQELSKYLKKVKELTDDFATMNHDVLEVRGREHFIKDPELSDKIDVLRPGNSEVSSLVSSKEWLEHDNNIEELLAEKEKLGGEKPEISSLENNREDIQGDRKEIDALSRIQEILSGEHKDLESLSNHREELVGETSENILEGYVDRILGNTDQGQTLSDHIERIGGDTSQESHLEDYKENLTGALKDEDLRGQRLDLNDQRETSLSRKRLDLSDSRENILENQVEKLFDQRESSLEDHREDLVDNRDTNLDKTRLDLTDQREVNLENERINISDTRENSLSQFKDQISDLRETYLEDHKESITDNRENSLENTKLTLSDSRENILENQVEKLFDQRESSLEDHREDLVDNRDTNLDKTRLDLTDTRDPALSDHVESLTDSREPSLEDQRENIPGTIGESTLMGQESLITPHGDTSLDETLHTTEDSIQLIADTLDETLENTRINIENNRENKLYTEPETLQPVGDTLDEELYTEITSRNLEGNTILDTSDEKLYTENTTIGLESNKIGDTLDENLYTEGDSRDLDMNKIPDTLDETLEDTRLDLVDSRENKLYEEADRIQRLDYVGTGDENPELYKERETIDENRLGDILDEKLYTDAKSRELEGNMIPDNPDEELYTENNSRDLEGNRILDDPNEELYTEATSRELEGNTISDTPDETLYTEKTSRELPGNEIDDTPDEDLYTAENSRGLGGNGIDDTLDEVLYTEDTSINLEGNRVGDTIDEELYTEDNSRDLDGNTIPDTLDETLYGISDSRDLDMNKIPDTLDETLEDWVEKMLADDAGHNSQSGDVHNNMSEGDEWGGPEHAAWEGDRIYTGKAMITADENEIKWDGNLEDTVIKRPDGRETEEEDEEETGLYDSVVGMIPDDVGHASTSFDQFNKMDNLDEWGDNDGFNPADTHEAWGGDRLYKGRAHRGLDQHVPGTGQEWANIEASVNGEGDIPEGPSGELYKVGNRIEMLADDTSNASLNGGDDKYLDSDSLGQGNHKHFDPNSDSLNTGKAKMLVNDKNHSTSSLDQNNDITDTFSGGDHKSWDGKTLYKSVAKRKEDNHEESNGHEFGEDDSLYDLGSVIDMLEDDITKTSNNGGDDKYLDSDSLGQGNHKHFDPEKDKLPTGKAVRGLDKHEPGKGHEFINTKSEEIEGGSDTGDNLYTIKDRISVLEDDTTKSNIGFGKDGVFLTEDDLERGTHKQFDPDSDKLNKGKAKMLANDENHKTSSLDHKNKIDDTFSGGDHKSWDGKTLYKGVAKRGDDNRDARDGEEFGENTSLGAEEGVVEVEQLYNTVQEMIANDKNHKTSSLDHKNKIDDTFSGGDHKSWDGKTLYTKNAKILDDDTTKSNIGFGKDGVFLTEDDLERGTHKQFDPDSDKLNKGKAKLISDDTTKANVKPGKDEALGTDDDIKGDAHNRWDGETLHKSSVDLSADDTTKEGAHRVTDLDSTLKAIMEARKSGDLNLYYTNVLKFAQGKTLNKGWGAKVSGLMSSYLVGDDISEGKAKEFEEALVKSVIQDDYSKNSVKLKNNNPREGCKKVESLSTDTVDGIDYHLPGFNLMGNGLNPSAYLRWLAENTVDKVPVKGKWRQLMIDEALGLLVYARELAEKATKTNRDRLPGGEGLLGELAGGLMNGGVSGLAKAGVKAAAKAIFGGGDVDLTIPQNRPTKKKGQPGNKEKGKTVYTALNDKSESPTKGAMLGQDYEFQKNYIQDDGKFKGFVTTADEIIGKSAGSINTVEDLYASLRASPYAITAGKITSGEYNPLKVQTLDSNAFWEIIFNPFVGKENGNCSYLPPISEINTWNEVYHGVETGYGTWVPINGFELSKAKLTTKTLALFDGEINYPVSMEFTNELRLTFVDDQYKSWRTYFERCMDCAVYNSQIHGPEDYYDDGGDRVYDLAGYEREVDDYGGPLGITPTAKLLNKKANKISKSLSSSLGKKTKKLTAIDKKYQCVAPYKNITFRCTIYSLTPQLSTVSKYDLLLVLKDFVEERSGEIDGDPGDLTVAFSIVGENPSAERQKAKIGDVEAMKKRQNNDKSRSNTASIISSAANKVIGLL